MKKLLITAAAGAVALSAVASANHHENHGGNFDPKAGKHIVVKMDLLGEKKNTKIGEVVAVETPYGVAFFPNLNGLTPGLHGFHVHANADCGKTDKGLGMKAGGHFDPENTGKHSFPWDDAGHKGDLPALFVAADGTATNPVLAPKIKSLDELKKHALMVHVGGDNHSDHPAALGGGGARMGCGVIK